MVMDWSLLVLLSPPALERYADLAAELSARFAPSVLYGVPTFFARVVETCNRESFRSLRCVVSAGEALGVGLGERLVEFFGGIPILDGIGSTEVGQTFVSNSVGEWRLGTLGKVLQPYEIRVVAPNGANSARSHCRRRRNRFPPAARLPGCPTRDVGLP